MVTYTQTIRWQQSANCLSVPDHFLGLALKCLKATLVIRSIFRILSSIYDGAFCENNSPLRKWSKFQRISLCGNFVQTHSFCNVFNDSPEHLRNLLFSTKFPYLEIRWNYGILSSEWLLAINYFHTKKFIIDDS